MTVSLASPSEFAIKRMKRIEQSNRARARDMGCEAVPVDFVEICAAQGWLCSLCGGLMDPELTPPDRQSVSLQHSPSLSCGGHHTPGHVEGAHLGCNLDDGRAVATKTAAKIKRQAGITGPQRDGKPSKGQIQSAGFQTNRDSEFKQTMDGRIVRRDAGGMKR